MELEKKYSEIKEQSLRKIDMVCVHFYLNGGC